jgi:hypothetical protein
MKFFKETVKSQDEPIVVQEKSHFMNKVVIWYFVSNLPLVYLRSLSSENGTQLEKLYNCFTVR